MARADLWTCSKCGRRFVNVNQWHGCGPYSVDSFLEGKGPAARALFDRFVATVGGCGAFEFAPAKTRVGFQVRTVFAAVNRLSEDRLDAHVVLTWVVNSPRIRRIESFSDHSHVHHFQVRSPDELDDEIRALACESDAQAG